MVKQHVLVLYFTLLAYSTNVNFTTGISTPILRVNSPAYTSLPTTRSTPTLATYRHIDSDNLVILAGTNITITCRWSPTRAYWHFYSLTSGAAPCSFNSSRLYRGISLCPSAPRISLANSYSSWPSSTTLTIRRARLSDAGTYICGSRNPYTLSTADSVTVGVIASYPAIKSTAIDGCVPEGQNVSLVCQVTYNGTNLMPLVMEWYKYTSYYNSYALNYSYAGNSDTTNASSVHQSSLTFTATSTEFYRCRVACSPPTGIVVPGVNSQTASTHGTFFSSPFVSRTVANCSSKVEFTVNGGSSVESGVSLTVGDVIACSGEGALLDRWRNGDAEIYGKTIRISQSGSFNYECSVFVECGTGMFCPFTKNISGFARGIQDNNTPTSYKTAMIALAVLCSIILVGVIAVGAFVLYRRSRIKMCVRSSSEETNTNELEERPNIENMYDNAIVLAAATDDTTDVHGEKSQSVYQDLSIGARRAEPIFYETIKPRVLPKPPLRGESHA